MAASIVAAIRLRGQEIRPTPGLAAIVKDSLDLARLVLTEIEHKGMRPGERFIKNFSQLVWPLPNAPWLLRRCAFSLLRSGVVFHLAVRCLLFCDHEFQCC